MGVFQHWLGLSEEQLLTVFKLITGIKVSRTRPFRCLVSQANNALRASCSFWGLIWFLFLPRKLLARWSNDPGKSHACLVVGSMGIFQQVLQPVRLQKHWSWPKILKWRVLILPDMMGMMGNFCTLQMLSDLKLWNFHLRRCLTYTRCFWWCQWYSPSLGSEDEHYLQRVQVLWLFVTSCLDQQVFWWWLDMALRFERYHLWKASFHLGPGYGWRGQQGRAWTTKIEGKPFVEWWISD